MSELAPIAVRAAAPAHLTLPTAGDLTWRPWRAADAADLADLMTAILVFADRPYRIATDEVEDLMGSSSLDLATSTLVGIDANGVMRAWAMAEYSPSDTEAKVNVSGGVHPELWNQGIGTDLLAWAVGRSRQILAASGSDQTAMITTSIDDDYPGERHNLIKAARFTPVRYFRNLVRDLRAPDADPLPDAPIPAGLRLVEFTDETNEPMRLAVNDAFRDHWGSDPKTSEQWNEPHSTHVPEWSFALVDDAVNGDAEHPEEPGADGPYVVGVHTGEKYEEDWEAQGFTAGYTCTLGVRRAYRGRGIAPALLAEAMRRFREAGMDKAELDVDADNPSGAFELYTRMGYVQCDASTVFAIRI